MADTGSPLRPGLFQGSVDAVKAWGEVHQRQRRPRLPQVVVKTADSKLTADDAQNGITTACGNSLALVGTTALFLDNMKPAEQCKDKAGQPTGIPDLAVLQTYAAQQCSPVSFAALPDGAARARTAAPACARSRRADVTQNCYFKKYGKDALHGVYLVPTDLPSTIAVVDAAVRGRREARHQAGRRVRRERALDAVRRTRRTCRRSRRTSPRSPATAPTT